MIEMLKVVVLIVVNLLKVIEVTVGGFGRM